MRAIVKFAVRTLALAVLFGVAGLAVLPSSSAAAPRGSTGRTELQCQGLYLNCLDGCRQISNGTLRNACINSCDDAFIACLPPNTRLEQLGAITVLGVTERILGATESILGNLSQIHTQLNNLQIQVQNVCAAPDLVPLPSPGVAGPLGFCRLNADGTKLQVLVHNQGAAETDLSGTVTRVVFSTTSGPVQLPSPDVVNTSALSSGGSQLVEFDKPSNCTGAVEGNCDFTIGVDVTNAVSESNETNNNAAGTCGPFLF